MLWSFICQIVSALGAIHRAGLACRAVSATKILLTGKNRYRLGCLGVVDVLRYDGGKNIQHFQQEDLMSLGKLVLCMACRSPTATENIRQSLQMVTESYSPGLHDVIVQLVTKSDALATADDLCHTIAPPIYIPAKRPGLFHKYRQHRFARQGRLRWPMAAMF